MVLELQTVVLQLLLPCLLLWWLQAAVIKLECWLRFLVCVAYFWIIRHTTLWVILPFTTGLFYLACALLLLVMKIVSTQQQAKNSPYSPRQTLSASLLLIVFIAVAFYLTGARQVDDKSVVTLDFPFAAGTHYVVNGGALALLNAHHLTLSAQTRYTNYRGQSYGVDILATNQYGLISSGILPRDPHAYFIFW
jgi:hypothetical protein